jgi:hypothetical protein
MNKRTRISQSPQLSKTCEMRPAFGKLAAYLGRYRGPVMEIRMSWTHLPENLRSTFVDMALNDIQAKLAAAEGIDVEFSAVEFNVIPLQPSEG